MYRQYVTTKEALEIILDQVPEPQIENVPLGQAADRILAEKVTATYPIPPFDRSPYDGYAVRFEDIITASENTPVTLKVIEEIPAGHVPKKELSAGEAARIMTGAPIPKNADTIIKFEDTHLQKDENQHYVDDLQQIQILRRPKAAGNYSKVGEDMDTGDCMLEVGRIIDPAAIAVMATFGYRCINVYSRPTAIVLASGDELVTADQPLAPSKIRNSNAPSLTAQLRAWGVDAVEGGIAQDDHQQLANMILEALQTHQIVITTGGVSAGDYDVMKEVLQSIGAEILFWRVAMRPGTPLVVAKWGDRIIFGLSGNPSAAYISCELFVRAYVLKIQKHADYWRNPVQARLIADLETVSQDRFLRAVAYVDPLGHLVVKPLPKQKSGILANLLDTNALIYIPAGDYNTKIGGMVEVILLKPPKGLDGYGI